MTAGQCSGYLQRKPDLQLNEWQHALLPGAIEPGGRQNKGQLQRAGLLLETIGAGERSRTLDLLITSELLYQLSYTGKFGTQAPKGWDST